MSNKNQSQRIQDLRSRLSKPPEEWSGADVVEWLRHLELEQYAQNFSNLSVDGYIILDLTEEDLEGELNVSVRLHRKKLLKAIEELRQIEREPFMIPKQKTMVSMSIEPSSINANTRVRPPEVSMTHTPIEPPALPIDPSGPHLYVVSLEGPTEVNYRVGTEPVKIGRHSSNQISIIDESISRHHAQIEFVGGNFYLKDIGSMTGTFVRISQPLVLKRDMILEVGSYQFQVSDIFVPSDDRSEEDEPYVVLEICESPDETVERLIVHNESSIGRKPTNTLSFPEDPHMSNLHAKFNLIGNKFVFEDMESTNGSWLRLSSQGEKSAPYLLDRYVAFKIGNTAMYEVKLPVSAPEPESDSNTLDRSSCGDRCSICWDAERDCLILPCRHNVSCVKCIKNVKLCPLCRIAIKDIIKIYK